MALLKELKGVNLSCSSDLASTSATVEEQYSSMLMSLGSSGRAIDRFSPHLRDPLRAKSRDPAEEPTHSSPSSTTTNNNTTSKPKLFGSSSSTKIKAPTQQQLISPASSSRYLLSGSGSASDDTWDSTPPQAPELVVSEVAREEEAWRSFQYAPKALQSSASTVINKAAEIEPSTEFQSIKWEEFDDPEYSSSSSSSSSPSSSSSNTRPQNHQVVVLRVSLHCKGCEAKVRKHISKMEGVTSFTTDLVNKKVTVIGDVTPLGVLNSISKVKNAQLWRSLPPKSSSSTKNLS